MNKNTKRIRNLVLLAILAALIVGLQFIGGISIGPFSITLTLIPIVVGAILLGPVFGAVLGLVFGLIVSIFSITGRDPGGQMVFAASPVIAWALCLLKGAAAGFLPAVVYRAVKQKTLAAYLASMTAPVANTGIFIVGILLFFRPLLETWAGGQNALVYAITGLAGINFLIEFAVAVLFAPAVALVVKSVGKSYFE
ncbi:MAG: ECF transporter S component [Clostridia bacterium]|nr:ECF transporter S component [Clostridia bacterium]